MKDKLILKDLSAIELEPGSGLSGLKVLSADKTAMTVTWDKLTPDNLAEVRIQNGEGLTVGIYTGLLAVSETSAVNADGSILTSFNLREKSDMEKRLEALEAGQAVQDGAIMDVADILSVVADQVGGGVQ